MHAGIIVKHENRRGCGYRDKPGAMYLVDDGISVPCGKLPIALETCPCCGHGIKQSRGWTWINIYQLLEKSGIECKSIQTAKIDKETDTDKLVEKLIMPDCNHCPLNPKAIIDFDSDKVIDDYYIGNINSTRNEQDSQWESGRCGLLWIGKQYYKTPKDFTLEAAEMGISRRVASLPNDFRLGETWIALAHPNTMSEIKRTEDGAMVKHIPGIFNIFKPKRIEVIVTGEEDDTVIDGYLEKGLTPVKVIKTGETIEMEFE